MILTEKRSIPLLFALTVFLLGVLTKLNVPLAEWDQVSLDAAVNWSKGINTPWEFVHPPLYPFFLTVLFKLFGSGVIVARLGNAFCVLITAFFLYHLTHRLYNKEAALWATIFYLLSPVSIQGVISMDVADTSLLPLIFVLIANCLIDNTLHPRLQTILSLSLLITICFWAKVTSSLGLVTALLAGILLCFSVIRWRSNYTLLLFNTVAIVIGILIFLLTWVGISRLLWGSHSTHTVLIIPWLEIYSGFQQSSDFSSLSARVFDVLRIVFWFSPYFLAIWLISSLDKVRRTSEVNDSKDRLKLLFIWTSLLYFIGYLIIGGTNWGFPRYHAAILPLICIFVGEYISRTAAMINKKMLLTICFLVTMLTIVITLLSDDPIYFLNLRLKELLLAGPDSKAIVSEFVMIFFAYYGLPLICCIILSVFIKIENVNKLIAICLLVGALTTLITLDIQQILASYRTSSQYGAEGKAQMLQEVRSNLEDGDYLLATPEFIYDLNDKKLPLIKWEVWKSRDRFYSFVDSYNPKVIIAGLTVNTYIQLRWLLCEETRYFLSKKYQSIRIGTYYLWFRR